MCELRKWFKKIIRTFGNTSEHRIGSPLSFVPLLPPRKRTLTLPLREDQANPKQATASQTQCLFLARLPIEIRILIYEELFCYRSILLEAKYDEAKKRYQFQSFVSMGTELLGQADPRSPSRKSIPVDPECLIDGNSQPRARWKGNGFAMLLTCRQAYSEGIDLLYRANEFHFCDVRSLRLFPDAILPARRASVTSIVFNWPLPEWVQPQRRGDTWHGRAYDPSWKVLASSFPNLRKLRVRLLARGWPNQYDKGESADFRLAWLRPLDLFASLKLDVFEICLPTAYFNCLGGEDANKGKPWRLVKTRSEYQELYIWKLPVTE